MIHTHTTITLADTKVDLLNAEDALELMAVRAATLAEPPLAVASVNLDHIHHFGTGSRWVHALDNDDDVPDGEPAPVEWLNLLDGAPVVAAATRKTGTHWPRLAGSDLIEPLLDRAARDRLSVGFFGGTKETHDQLRRRLGETRPTLKVAGYWAPTRVELSDPARSAVLARAVAYAGVDILVVSLGKPRQELWINQYGALTGAPLLLAFGAVVDFLAGRVDRAPRGVADHGLEWAWRLSREPRRLSRRYLVQGPRALAKLRSANSTLGAARTLPDLVDPRDAAAELAGEPRVAANRVGKSSGSVIIPAHNEAAVIERTLRPLADAATTGQLEVVVVCNGCTDDTAELARNFSGVTVIEIDDASKSLALNVGDEAATVWPRMYLDADVEISPGAIVDVLDSLSDGPTLAARPTAAYDLDGAGPMVRSYYRARARVPSLKLGLWGAGAYALSESGHERLGNFPPLSGDDFWVDQLFVHSEKAVVDTHPVVVRTPRDVHTLIGILRRGRRGVAQAVNADSRMNTSTSQTLRELAKGATGARELADAVVYAILSLAGRFGALRRTHPTTWERDDSSR
jgi:exopolysaccharide biosynthesis WecB/TagA/CpsF family protein